MSFSLSSITVERLVEKEVHSKLFGKKNALPPYAATLLAYQSELDRARISEERSMFNQLKKMKVSISRVHQQPKIIDDTYYTALENLLNFIEKDIVSFKSLLRERREKTSVEEMTMEREMSMIEKRVESMEEELARIDQLTEDPLSHPFRSVKRESVKTNEATPPEVQALQAFLRETGANGGWNEKDHQQFLHIRNQYKGNLHQLAERCVYEIPQMDYRLVEDHEEWFNKFTVLLRAQKAAIHRWKLNKEAIKANDVAQQEEKHAREAAKARHEEGEMRKREKEERELRIMEWKEEQKKKEEEERVRTQQEEERRVAEEKERELRHRIFMKEKLKEYVAQKEEDERRRYDDDDATEKRIGTPINNKVTAKDLEKFQERDRMKVIEKQQKAMVDKLQKADKEARLEKIRKQVQVSAPRDPSRLTKPTAAFEVRVNEVEQKPLYPNMDFNGPFATRRATPAWRQGV